MGKVAARVYERLQERLQRSRTPSTSTTCCCTRYLLLKNHADVLEAYQDRFRYLMVDEYQDTNRAQYAITQLLAAKRRNIMVVGDDDQSIYSVARRRHCATSWNSSSDYPERQGGEAGAELPQRGQCAWPRPTPSSRTTSTARQKRLFTGRGRRREDLACTWPPTSATRAAGSPARSERRRSEGTSYNNMAVFYRTNAQSAACWKTCCCAPACPTASSGGTRFFDRAEIRDVMAYLTLVVNPADDIAAKRVVNVPRRGVGKTTIERIDQYAPRDGACRFCTAAELAVVDPDIRASTRNAVGEFIQAASRTARTYGGDLRKVVEMIIDKAGLIRALQDEGTDEARGRVENIQEFLGVVDEFVQTHDAEESDFAAPTVGEDESAEPVRVLRGDSLADFIEWVRLRTDLDTVTEDGQAVTLMTVHSSKGLEFDCVWVAGMEETLFPHMNSVGDAAAVEEERRLARTWPSPAPASACASPAPSSARSSARRTRTPSRASSARSPASCARRAGWDRRAFPAPVGRSAAAAGASPVRAPRRGGPRVRALERLGRAGTLVCRVPRGHGYGACGRQRRRRIPHRLGPHRCGGEPERGEEGGRPGRLSPPGTPWITRPSAAALS